MLLTSAMSRDLGADLARHPVLHIQFSPERPHEGAAIAQEERTHRVAALDRTRYDVPATIGCDRALPALHLGKKVEFLSQSDW